jgi:CRISPR system Cascade subunit CasB
MSDIDFVKIRKLYEQLPSGPRADLRRVGQLDEISEIAASYRLFPGRRIDRGLQRVLFCLPWIKHGTGSLGAALAAKKINERRLFQVIRSESPNDLIQLRRLLQWAEPTADWADFGPQILYWNDHNKRRLLESYYIGNTESVQS